ncbi:MAG: hypothetical protein ACOY82_16470 [Pseudomonadota bacterium]
MTTHRLFRTACLAAALALPGLASAGDVDLFGAKLTLPVPTEEAALWEREIDTKSAFLLDVEEVQGYTLPREDGSRLVVSAMVLGFQDELRKPKSPEETQRMRDDLVASIRKENSSRNIELFEIDGAHAYRYAFALDKDGKVLGQSAVLGIVFPEFSLRLRLSAPEGSFEQAKLLAIFDTVKLDRVRIKAMLDEAAAIKKAAVSGTTVNTSIGSFQFQSGSRPSLLSVEAKRDRFSGMNISTTFLVARDGFWSSQRAVATFMCMPIGMDAEKDEFAEELRKNESISQLKVSPPITTGSFPMRRYDYRQSSKGVAMDVTSWMVQGKQQTLGVMMLGFYNDSFRTQLEKSVGQTQGQCQPIPGSRQE